MAMNHHLLDWLGIRVKLANGRKVNQPAADPLWVTIDLDLQWIRSERKKLSSYV